MNIILRKFTYDNDLHIMHAVGEDFIHGHRKKINQYVNKLVGHMPMYQNLLQSCCN